VPSKADNKTPYEVWAGKKPSIKHLHIWGCLAEARPYRLHERKLDSRTISCYFFYYVKRSQGYKFYDPTLKSFFETRSARFLEKVDFGKEKNIKNIVFAEKHVIDIAQVLIPIIVQEITPIIENNVPIIVDDIVQEQYNNKVLPQIPIQQPQEVSLRRFVRKRRSSIPNDYIIFLQEHEDGIGLT